MKEKVEYFDAEQDAEISREFWSAWLEAEMREQERVDGIIAGSVIILTLLLGLIWWGVFA